MRWRGLAPVGPLAGFALLAAGFLWQPLLTGRAFLPSDLAFRYDHMWAAASVRRPAGEIAQNPILADVSDYYHPYRVFALQELARGRFPLWNPLMLVGTPFFASVQAALLDPVNAITLPFGAIPSWTAGAWLRLTLLGWFTFGFARAIRLSMVSSFAAGIVFMTCGFVVAWLNYPVVTSLVWMPALFWTSERLLEAGGRRWLAATALAVGALLVGGHPETQFLVGLAWAAYLACALSLLPAPRVRRRLGELGLAVALGFAVAAVQWAPFVDFLFGSHAFTSRARPLAPFDALEMALRGAVLLLPNLGGVRHLHDYWLPGFMNYNEQSGYIGLVTLALCAIGFRAARAQGGGDARRALFFALAAGVATALTIRAPGFHAVKAIPLLDVGHGVRWIAVASFCGALLAARGIDAVRSGASADRLSRSGLVLAALAALAFAALLAAWAAISALAGERDFAFLTVRGEVVRVRLAIVAGVLDPARLTVHPPLLFALAGAALLWAAGRGALSRQRAALLLVALLYLDLWVSGSRYNPVTPESDVFPPTPTTRYLEQQLAHERISAGGDLLRPNVAMVFGFRDLRGLEDVIDAEFDALYGDSLLRASGLPWLSRPVLRPEDVRLLDLAGVRYFLSAVPLRGPDPLPYRLAFRAQGILSYESLGFAPRAHAVVSARVVADAAAARAALLEPAFDPRREVVLVGEGEAREGPEGPAPQVDWLRDDPGSLALRVTLGAAGYLVLSDLWSPEWVATLDGNAAPVLRANGIFRAVAVPAGTHEVRFLFRPRLVYVCAVVSALALAGVALLFLPRRAGGRP